jgi:hypothetical protein
MTIDILPESRPRDRKGAVQTADGWMIPVYCANCGKRWGMVPEKHITFAFVLCESCVETHGVPAHFHMEPDRVFWDRVKEAMLDEQIDSLTQEDMQKHVNDSSSSIGKILRERCAILAKET